MSVLADRLLAVHAALRGAQVPHAFGGAIALAYCTHEPRGTRDIDINVFVDSAQAPAILALLPDGVEVGDRELQAATDEGQVRLWWDDTPIDVFFDVHDFHVEAAESIRTVPFARGEIPVLGCSSLAVFKVVFNRTRHWADIEEMAAAGALDASAIIGWAVRLFGPDDARVARLTSLWS